MRVDLRESVGGSADAAGNATLTIGPIEDKWRVNPISVDGQTARQALVKFYRGGRFLGQATGIPCYGGPFRVYPGETVDIVIAGAVANDSTLRAAFEGDRFSAGDDFPLDSTGGTMNAAGPAFSGYHADLPDTATDGHPLDVIVTGTQATGERYEFDGTIATGPAGSFHWEMGDDAGSDTLYAFAPPNDLAGGILVLTREIDLFPPGIAATDNIPRLELISRPGFLGSIVSIVADSLQKSGHEVLYVTSPASGDLVGTYPSPALASIVAPAGPIGDATHAPVVTIDAKGRVTALGTALITGSVPGGAAGGDLAGTYPNPTVAQASKAFLFSGTNTLALATDQNDLDPGADTVVLMINASAPLNITGLSGGADGRIIELVNLGASAGAVTLKNASTSSVTTNRFSISEDLTLAAGASMLLIYANGRWRAPRSATSSALPAQLSSAGAAGAAGSGPSRGPHAHPQPPDGTLIKHKRVTTGSVAATSSALVTVTWDTAFANANYTVLAQVLDATATSLSLSVVHVETISASQVQVRVLNNAAGAITGTLHVLAIHD